MPFRTYMRNFKEMLKEVSPAAPFEMTRRGDLTASFITLEGIVN